jgi:hypothetical protein
MFLGGVAALPTCTAPAYPLPPRPHKKNARGAEGSGYATSLLVTPRSLPAAPRPAPPLRVQDAGEGGSEPGIAGGRGAPNLHSARLPAPSVPTQKGMWHGGERVSDQLPRHAPVPPRSPSCPPHSRMQKADAGAVEPGIAGGRVQPRRRTCVIAPRSHTETGGASLELHRHGELCKRVWKPEHPRTPQDPTTPKSLWEFMPRRSWERARIPKSPKTPKTSAELAALGERWLDLPPRLPEIAKFRRSLGSLGTLGNSRPRPPGHKLLEALGSLGSLGESMQS